MNWIKLLPFLPAMFLIGFSVWLAIKNQSRTKVKSNPPSQPILTDTKKILDDLSKSIDKNHNDVLETFDRIQNELRLSIARANGLYGTFLVKGKLEDENIVIPLLESTDWNIVRASGSRGFRPHTFYVSGNFIDTTYKFLIEIREQDLEPSKAYLYVENQNTITYFDSSTIQQLIFKIFPFKLEATPLHQIPKHAFKLPSDASEYFKIDIAYKLLKLYKIGVNYTIVYNDTALPMDSRGIWISFNSDEDATTYKMIFE